MARDSGRQLCYVIAFLFYIAGGFFAEGRYNGFIVSEIRK